MKEPKTSRLRQEGTFAAVDIGTSKTVCFIANLEPDNDTRVIGVGHQLSKGIRSGHITDFIEAQTSVVSAVHAAEQMAGIQVENVVVNVSSAHIHTRSIHVDLTLTGQAVSDRDLADVLREGRSSVEQEDSALLHVFPVEYALDGNRGIKDPRGMVGETLSAELHFLFCPQVMARNLTNLFANCHLNISEFVVAPHASALAVLEPDEMDLGVTVIDMGGGTTGYSVFAHGKNICSGAVALGGVHVTNDIAKGLSTSLTHAERLKTLHGSAIATAADDKAMIDVPQLGEEQD
jgi:cell division protein FtsA